MIADESYNEFISVTSILSEKEQELLSAMRNKKVKEINIKFNDEEKKSFDIITTKKGLVDKTEVAMILEQMISKPYQTISFTTNNNGKVSFQSEYRKRIQE